MPQPGRGRRRPQRPEERKKKGSARSFGYAQDKCIVPLRANGKWKRGAWEGLGVLGIVGWIGD